MASAPQEEKKEEKIPGRFYSCETVLKSTWECVVHALWRRYPNPYSKHVLSEDVVSRRSEKNILRSKRLLSKTNKAPKWIEKFIGGAGQAAFVIEESIVDSSTRTFTTHTRNINFTKLLSIEEKCTYYTCPEDNSWTCCRKQAWIRSGLMGLSRAVEKFGVERYKKNAKKAEAGLVTVIERLFYVPSFSDTPTKPRPHSVSAHN
ncbi:PRELI domain-containing protein 1, mitochondrial-like [Halichondria panicea]|uniref:PRELI domain-containing protein 1, mitochondrial-like n=1 Tax=Halichondria panicea TaxID=6063 RepID=UPI00312B3BA9